MKYILLSLLLFTSGLTLAQPSVKWQKCIGGKSNEFPGGMIETRDGGYIMAAQTKSAEGDVTSNHGSYDLWVIKMNAQFSIEWQKTYGGSRDDGAGSILQTPDGGYIIAASTNSDDGDLKDVFKGDSTQSDIWILKIDDKGTIQWQKTYGGSKNDFLASMIQTDENGYVITGLTQSDNGDVTGFHSGSGYDSWIFQISALGTIQWSKTLGGSKDDELYSLSQTRDGGFILNGFTYSTDGDVTGRSFDTTNGDVWFVKLSGKGDLLWQKTYGGSAFDESFGAIPTLDNGYAIAGLTFSKDGDASGLHGIYFSDCWVIKIDSIGKLEWQKTLGGSNGDAAYSILQTSDSGYVVSGNVASDDGDVTDFHGISDCWIFKLNSSGGLLWQKTLGGSGSDANIGSGIMPLRDSGFLIVTVTSSIDGDVSGRKGDSSADGDIWFVKVSFEKNGVERAQLLKKSDVSLYPNPSSGTVKINCVLEKASFVTVQIFDVLGNRLRTLFVGKEEAGIYDHNDDISDLPTGRYFLRIDIDGKSVINTLELIK